jgi:hypothetical protein
VDTLDEQAEVGKKKRKSRKRNEGEIIHKYIKKKRNKIKNSNVCCCLLLLLLFSSDTIKNYSPQKGEKQKLKERNLRCASRLSIPTWFTNGHTQKEKKKWMNPRKDQLGRGNTSGELHDQYIIIGCSMAK